MRKLRLFKTHSDYDEYINGQGVVYPNVCRCRDNNDVHYNPLKTIVTAKFVGNGEQQCLYYFYDDDDPQYGRSGATSFYEIKIDGEKVNISDIDNNRGLYTFSEGEHTVQYRLKETKKIKSALFLGSDMTEFTISDNINTIDAGAFFRCYSLTSVTIPNCVKEIYERAFEGVSLISLDIDMDTINNGIFSDMSDLENVQLGENVKMIEDGAFCSCLNINSQDKSAILNINENAICKMYNIIATFPSNTEKALLGFTKSLSYYLNGETKIPNNEIILEQIN